MVSPLESTISGRTLLSAEVYDLKSLKGPSAFFYFAELDFLSLGTGFLGSIYLPLSTPDGIPLLSFRI